MSIEAILAIVGVALIAFALLLFVGMPWLAHLQDKAERLGAFGPKPTPKERPRPRLVQMRAWILRAVCRALLPRGVWIGKEFGVYSQREVVVFGRLDSRGVLQGVLDNEAFSVQPQR